MKLGSLFSGIGGLEMGLVRSIPNLHTVWQVEQNAYCQKVLRKHWSVPIYDDVRTVGAHNLEPVDILCAGFPCQSISIAGKMKGLEDEEKSGLWWNVHRLVSEFQSIGRQPILVLENVANILRVGGPDVVGSLTAIGYDCEWTIISAAQCGAPHLRKRWFAVAYPSTIGYYLRNELAFANTISTRTQVQTEGQQPSKQMSGSTSKAYWQGFPTQSPVCRRDDGIPNRVDRLRALGNAVVPQCAEWIGKQIANSGLLEVSCLQHN
tara:strand:- start:16798 stop:17589 length:792 start_codon:yes stop_codon:yes gene_type:complete